MADERLIDALVEEAPTFDRSAAEQGREPVHLVGRLRGDGPGRFRLFLGSSGRGSHTFGGRVDDVIEAEVVADTGNPLTRVVRLTLPAGASLDVGTVVSAKEASVAQAWMLRPHRGVYVQDGARPFVLLRDDETVDGQAPEGERPIVLLDDSDPFGNPFRGSLPEGPRKQLIGDPRPITLGGTQQERPKEAWEDKQPWEDKMPWHDWPQGQFGPFTGPPDWWHPPMAWPPVAGPGQAVGPVKTPWLDAKAPWEDLLWPPGKQGPGWLGPFTKPAWQDLQLWPPAPGGAGGIDPLPWKPKSPFYDVIEKLPPFGLDPSPLPEWGKKITFPKPIFDDPGQSTFGLDYALPW